MKFGLMSLHTQTSLHAGAGSNDGVVDLPVQREAHTAYPCVFGSSLKGALRAHAELRVKDVNVNDLFGQAGSDDDGNAGALLVGDARLLLLPIRSLTGQFRWVTSPSVLARWQTDAKRFGNVLDFTLPSGIDAQQALIASGADMQTLYLEEYAFKTKVVDLNKLIGYLSAYMSYTNAEELLKNQLTVISDEDFAYLAQYTLPVNPHIAVDSKTKLVKGGALWYEETVPADTIFYSGIAADGTRKKGGSSAADNWNAFDTMLKVSKSWVQVGGNETVGMGWCFARLQSNEQTGE